VKKKKFKRFGYILFTMIQPVWFNSILMVLFGFFLFLLCDLTVKYTNRTSKCEVGGIAFRNRLPQRIKEGAAAEPTGSEA
jgi:hypothetical protein